MTENAGTYLFLSGADMDPTEIRKAFPNARFVARGFTEAHAGEISSNFSDVVASPGMGDVWGILLTTPVSYGPDERRHEITTDDGRHFNAVIVGDKMVDGFKRSVYAAARYWELPTGYTGRLELVTPKLGAAHPGDAE
jgi:hypothetical protein